MVNHKLLRLSATLVRLVCLTLCVLSVGLFITSIPLYFAHLHLLCTDTAAACATAGQPTPGDVRRLHELGLSLDSYATYIIVTMSIFALGYWLVSALLFWRKSHDRLALLAAVSLGTFPMVFNPGSNTLPSPWLSLSLVLSALSSLCFVLFGYVFPSGHFVPRWMRWVFVVALLYWGFDAFFPVSSFNPFSRSQVLNALTYLGLLGGIIVVQIYRYRRVSSPAQRQQIRWVVYGASMGVGGYLVLFTLALVFPSLFQIGSPGSLIQWAAAYGLGLLVPFSLGLAILRSRLWDIDLLINRTLVYGMLTVMLALVYVGLVIGLQLLLSSIISHGSGVAIVISTLAIAALCQPLRHRIRQIIDRRFYRRKYNAVQTLAAFSTTLRHEVDLDQLREVLLAVVQETMQPAHVSLWVRPPVLSRQRNTRLLPRIEEEERKKTDEPCWLLRVDDLAGRHTGMDSGPMAGSTLDAEYSPQMVDPLSH
ncbi:MAG TPA: hypothetical protein VFQ36_19350 [Ktedonobacteraceae bacterium]|nr:hypothetical protein [Ktedonobacteraceae bacterium]